MPGITRAYLAALSMITAQIEALAQQVTEAPKHPPDQDVFTSCPGPAAAGP